MTLHGNESPDGVVKSRVAENVSGRHGRLPELFTR
jgi:hypothetical protein